MPEKIFSFMHNKRNNPSLRGGTGIDNLIILEKIFSSQHNKTGITTFKQKQ